MKICLAALSSLAVAAAQSLFLLALGITARAQNASPTPTSDGELEHLTVTGYLIPRVGEGPEPVATLNQDFITKQAYQTVNDVLNNYPGGMSSSNVQLFTGNSNSPASSAYTLKELPVGSTLVLIDGFRFPDYAISINAGTLPFVDINSIPLAGVDRIEILSWLELAPLAG
jgi:outer membrane receptor protein involved in Fe transport